MADVATAPIGRRPMFRFNWYRVVRSWRQFCDWLKWLGHKPDNLESFARRELELAGWFKKDEMYGDMMGNAVMTLVREFSGEGHSGMSAGVAIGLFNRVARYESLTSLTGADDEWMEVADGLYQNNRCFSVFKDAKRFGGQAYHGEAVVFEDADGSRYTNSDSALPIEFPYTPKTEIVKRK